MMPRFLPRLALVVGACIAPATAHAHLIGGRLGDFYGGLLHPLISLEHVVPWLALCLLAGLQPPKVARWIFVAFPLGLLAGLALSVHAPESPLLSSMNVASFIVAGALVALALRLSAPVLAAIAFVFGVSHGFANGAGLPPEVNWLLFTLGVTAAGYLFVTIVTALVTIFRDGTNWRTIAVRAAGSWIAAIGIMALGVREFAPWL
jgi:hydrogenase/urease accessory protein HupE